MSKRKRGQTERKQHISVEIRYNDFIRLMKYTDRNMSKMVRDFVAWTLSNEEIEKAIYVRGDNVASVIERVNLDTVRKVIREEINSTTENK